MRPACLRDRSPNLAVREGPWKLLLNANGSGAELYDLVADRAEAHDLSAANPEIAKRLAEATLKWWKALPPPPAVP